MRFVRALCLLGTFARLHPEALFLWVVFHGLFLVQLVPKNVFTSSAFLAGQLGVAFVFTQGAARSHSFEFIRTAGGGAFLWRALAASWLLSLHLPSLGVYFFLNGVPNGETIISFMPAEGAVLAFFCRCGSALPSLGVPFL